VSSPGRQSLARGRAAFGRPRGGPSLDESACPLNALISVVVRSMGRPELAHALESLAHQDHPRLDVIVVDATGGCHPDLPAVAWPEGHEVRIVGGRQRLRRPDAANVGLDAVRGEWFTFLDDDDTCEPSHLSSLLAAARQHPEALVVYGQGRMLDPQGRVETLFGHPFNRALMHYGPLCYWQAALIRTRVRELGCRFDPQFDVCEDRDLLAQIAQHGDFAFVPLATLNYRPDLGTSGTGRGANRNDARRILYDTRLKAKWSGPGAYHWARVAGRCRRGVRAFIAGDLDAAQAWFEAALRDYPGDPNAMNGLARVALARGDTARALEHARTAVAINPTAGDYRDTLALVEHAARGPVPRTARCPCGSGHRYKECCGRLDAVAAAPPRNARVREACMAASAALASDDAQTAYRLLGDAEPDTPDAEFGMLLEACCERLCAQQRREGQLRMARELLDGLRARRPPSIGAGPSFVTPDERFELAETLDGAALTRIVIRVLHDDPQALIERLVEIEESGRALDVEVVYEGFSV